MPWKRRATPGPHGASAYRCGAKWLRRCSRSQAKWSKDGDIDAVVVAAPEPGEIDSLRQALSNSGLYEAVGDDVTDANEQAVNDAPTVLIMGQNTAEELEGALRYSALELHY